MPRAVRMSKLRTNSDRSGEPRSEEGLPTPDLQRTQPKLHVNWSQLEHPDPEFLCSMEAKSWSLLTNLHTQQVKTNLLVSKAEKLVYGHLKFNRELKERRLKFSNDKSLKYGKSKRSETAEFINKLNKLDWLDTVIPAPNTGIQKTTSHRHGHVALDWDLFSDSLLDVVKSMTQEKQKERIRVLFDSLLHKKGVLQREIDTLDWIFEDDDEDAKSLIKMLHKRGMFDKKYSMARVYEKGNTISADNLLLLAQKHPKIPIFNIFEWKHAKMKETELMDLKYFEIDEEQLDWVNIAVTLWYDFGYEVTPEHCKVFWRSDISQKEKSLEDNMLPAVVMISNIVVFHYTDWEKILRTLRKRTTKDSINDWKNFYGRLVAHEIGDIRVIVKELIAKHIPGKLPPELLVFEQMVNKIGTDWKKVSRCTGITVGKCKRLYEMISEAKNVQPSESENDGQDDSDSLVQISQSQMLDMTQVFKSAMTCTGIDFKKLIEKTGREEESTKTQLESEKVENLVDESIFPNHPFSLIEDTVLLIILEQIKLHIIMEQKFSCLQIYLPWRTSESWLSRLRLLAQARQDPYSIHEDLLLIYLHHKIPHNWLKMASYFDSRDRKALRGRFNVLTKYLEQGVSLYDFHQFSTTPFRTIIHYPYIKRVIEFLDSICSNFNQLSSLPTFGGFIWNQLPTESELLGFIAQTGEYWLLRVRRTLLAFIAQKNRRDFIPSAHSVSPPKKSREESSNLSKQNAQLLPSLREPSGGMKQQSSRRLNSTSGQENIEYKFCDGTASEILHNVEKTEYIPDMTINPRAEDNTLTDCEVTPNAEPISNDDSTPTKIACISGKGKKAPKLRRIRAEAAKARWAKRIKKEPDITDNDCPAPKIC